MSAAVSASLLAHFVHGEDRDVLVYLPSNIVRKEERTREFTVGRDDIVCRSVGEDEWERVFF
jgi:hypothetical protein